MRLWVSRCEGVTSRLAVQAAATACVAGLVRLSERAASGWFGRRGLRADECGKVK